MWLNRFGFKFKNMARARISHLVSLSVALVLLKFFKCQDSSHRAALTHELIHLALSSLFGQALGLCNYASIQSYVHFKVGAMCFTIFTRNITL